LCLATSTTTSSHHRFVPSLDSFQLCLSPIVASRWLGREWKLELGQASGIPELLRPHRWKGTWEPAWVLLREAVREEGKAHASFPIVRYISGWGCPVPHLTIAAGTSTYDDSHLFFFALFFFFFFPRGHFAAGHCILRFHSEHYPSAVLPSHLGHQRLFTGICNHILGTTTPLYVLYMCTLHPRTHTHTHTQCTVQEQTLIHCPDSRPLPPAHPLSSAVSPFSIPLLLSANASLRLSSPAGQQQCQSRCG